MQLFAPIKTGVKKPDLGRVLFSVSALQLSHRLSSYHLRRALSGFLLLSHEVMKHVRVFSPCLSLAIIMFLCPTLTLSVSLVCSSCANARMCRRMGDRSSVVGTVLLVAA